MKHLSPIKALKRYLVNKRLKKKIATAIFRSIDDGKFKPGSKLIAHVNTMVLEDKEGSPYLAILLSGKEDILLLAALSTYMTLTTRVDKDEKIDRILKQWAAIKEVNTIQ